MKISRPLHCYLWIPVINAEFAGQKGECLEITAFSCFASYVYGARDLLLSLLKVEATFYFLSICPPPRLRCALQWYPLGNSLPNISVLNWGKVLHTLCTKRLIPCLLKLAKPCLLKPKSRSLSTNMYTNRKIMIKMLWMNPFAGNCFSRLGRCCIST